MQVTTVFKYNDTEHEVKINTTISFVDAKYIVANVTEASFDEKETYLPFERQVYFWYFVISRYTDFDMSEYSLATTYDLMLNSDFTDVIKENVSVRQFEMIEDSIDEAIDVRINKHPLTDIVNGLSEPINQLRELLDTFTNSEDAKESFKTLMDNLATLDTLTNAR